ncbi:hypothetical protein VTK26DRAFT_3339 [Humicola hyalothermophila]
MQQTRALNALEPWLAISNGVNDWRTASDLVTRATSDPNTYIFTELLEKPQIQALATYGNGEGVPYLELLKIFCYGTYATYISTPGLPALNEQQSRKLRQLSLLAIANATTDDNTTSPALTYASLQQALDLPSRQALEELVIGAIYAGLIKGQLNPRDSLVQVFGVAPLRDVAPTAIGSLLSDLQAWAGRCESTLESLEAQMAQLRADANQRAARAAARAEEMRRLVENEKNGGDDFYHGSVGKGGSNSNSIVTRSIKMSNNSMLTVGGGNSSSPLVPAPGTASPAAPSLQVKPALKRQIDGGPAGSGDMDAEKGEMDVDGDGNGNCADGNEKKRASRRKLGE